MLFRSCSPYSKSIPCTDQRDRRDGRVEDGRGSLGHAAALRFPSPLIEPDVPISGIRLSDWFHRETHGEAGAASVVSAAGFLLRLSIQLSPKDPDRSWCLQAHRQSPSPRHLQKHTRSQGPLLCRHYPASTLSGRRRRPMKSLPPSAAQTGRTVFPYPAFMKELSRSEAKVLVRRG